MTEDKATRYHRLKRRSEVYALLWSAVCFSALLLSGGSHWLATLATGVSGGSFWLAVPVVVFGLLVSHEIVALPLAFFRGHRLEQRYGLSHQPAAGWLTDHLKATAIGFVLASGAALITYGTMAIWPAYWWAVAGAMLALLVAGLASLAPVVLLPLFFRFTPLSRPALAARLQQLAERAGTRVVGVYEWALGEKSRRANAALTGLGATRRILVSDTMLSDYSDDEIEVVLAHELGHHVHHDIWRGIALESALMLLRFLAMDVALALIGPWVGVARLGDLAAMPLLLLAAGAVSLVLTPVGLALSRHHERKADRFALGLTSNPSAFISAMRRLGAQNLAEERPSRLVRWLFHSHPTLEERLAFAHGWKTEAAPIGPVTETTGH